VIKTLCRRARNGLKERASGRESGYEEGSPQFPVWGTLDENNWVSYPSYISLLIYLRNGMILNSVETILATRFKRG